MHILPDNMNSNLKKIILLTTTICLFAIETPAYADNTYILQLGSFDTKEQAEQKWQALKSQNPDTLGKLTLHIAEVSMSSDDKISYRTQAGPVDSHDSATKLCSAIQDKGGECYVIETAIFTSDSGPVASTAVANNDLSAEKNAISRSKAEPEAEPVTAQKTPVIPDRATKFLDDDEPAEKPVIAKTQPVAPVKIAENTIVSSSEKPQKTNDNFIPGREPKFLDDDEPAPKMAATETPAATSAPAAKPEENKLGFFGRLFGRSSRSGSTEDKITTAKSDSIPKTVGRVNVAEAIRVPLSEDTGNDQPASSHRTNAEPLFDIPASETDKMYWAQLNYFADEAAAHNFYEEFRNNYASLSDGLRMRITRPYAYANKSGHVTLRMGTFAISDIRTVCALASQHNLHCVSVKDIASTTTATAAAYMPQGNAGTKSVIENSVYWVQLGTFDAPYEAWGKWQEVQKSHKKITTQANATVTSPPASSAAKRLFRLRTGPYATEALANAFCNKLSRTGENCLVIGEQ